MRTNISVTTGIRAAARSGERASNKGEMEETAESNAEGFRVEL